jgi:hypothetical protein
MRSMFSTGTLLLLFSLFTTFNMISAFVSKASTTARAATRTFVSKTHLAAAGAGQAEVVLVGCGAPNRGMGWYHAVQMLDKK